MLDISDHIRPMTLSDVPRVAEIEAHAHIAPWTEAIFFDCLHTGYECWVLDIHQQIVGFGIVQHGVEEAHILNLCVATHFQQQGYGRALLLFLINEARKSDVKQLLLEVRASNLRAIHLYLQQGFTQIGIRKRYYPVPSSVSNANNREDAIMLALKL